MNDQTELEQTPRSILVERLDGIAVVLAICNILRKKGRKKIPDVLQEEEIFLEMFKKLLAIVGARERFGASIDVDNLDTLELSRLITPHCEEKPIICMELTSEIPVALHSEKARLVVEAIANLIASNE